MAHRRTPQPQTIKELREEFPAKGVRLTWGRGVAEKAGGPLAIGHIWIIGEANNREPVIHISFIGGPGMHARKQRAIAAAYAAAKAWERG